MQVQELRHGANELICKFRNSDMAQLNWYASSGVETRCQWTDMQVQEFRHGATQLICKFRSSDMVPLNWSASSGVETRCHLTNMQVQELRHGANELTVQVSSVTRCHWTDIHVRLRDMVPMKWYTRSALRHGATEMTSHFSCEMRCQWNGIQVKPRDTTKTGVLCRLPLMQLTRWYLAILCHDFSFPYKNICEEFST
jgi:hypothetical protein